MEICQPCVHTSAPLVTGDKSSPLRHRQGFDPRRAFGFIVAPPGDVFAHFSVIAGDSFALHDGSTVEYDAIRGDDGRWKPPASPRPQVEYRQRPPPPAAELHALPAPLNRATPRISHP
jgi:cold shock CspA family protein